MRILNSGGALNVAGPEEAPRKTQIREVSDNLRECAKGRELAERSGRKALAKLYERKIRSMSKDLRRAIKGAQCER